MQELLMFALSFSLTLNTIMDPSVTVKVICVTLLDVSLQIISESPFHNYSTKKLFGNTYYSSRLLLFCQKKYETPRLNKQFT